MKKITYIVLSLLLMASYSYGQGEVEANQFSRNDLNGTARAISMGGAFGALGGDLTGVSINPAGIAVYRSSEVAATVVFQSEKFKSPNETNTKNKFNFHNFGFVGYFPTRNPIVPVVNFGFAYNKVKSFDKEIGVVGESRGSSLMKYMAFKADGFYNDELKFVEDKYDPFGNPDIDWLPAFGVTSNLIVPKDNSNNTYRPLHLEPVSNDLFMKESGSIDTYDFTVGTSINNTLNVGVTLSLSDIYYNLYSQNSEDFNNGANAGYDLRNWLVSEGNGVGVKLGLIYRPINAFRLGLSYHSPTWYSMTERFSAEVKDDVTEYVNKDYGEYKNNYNKDYESLTTFSGEKRNDYDFKTPDKWTLSAAAVLSNSMILSLDYELTNYSRMKYSEPSGMITRPGESYDENVNILIKSDFKITSTVRAGLEYRITPQFSGRLGYAWMQNPYDTTLNEKGDVETVGTTTAYRLEGDAIYFTGGIGYRFSRNFYADLAVVYKTQDDELYSFPNVYDIDRAKIIIDAAPYKLTNNSIRGLLTIGYRF